MKVFVRFRNEDDAKASFILSRTGRIHCLPNDVYICDTEQLKVIEKNNIPYTIISIEEPETILSEKVLAL